MIRCHSSKICAPLVTGTLETLSGVPGPIVNPLSTLQTPTLQEWFFGQLPGWLKDFGGWLGRLGDSLLNGDKPGKGQGNGAGAGDPTFVQTPFMPPAPRPATNENIEGLVARISFPSQGSLVRATVPICGLAYGRDFKRYVVELGRGSDPSEWEVLRDSARAVTNDIDLRDIVHSGDVSVPGSLADLDAGLKSYVYRPTYPRNHPVNRRGIYTVRLTVEGMNGKRAQDMVSIRVAPVVPNATGGTVRSADGVVELEVPEHALKDSFRLFEIEPLAGAQQAALPVPEGELLSLPYRCIEESEEFLCPVQLKFRTRSLDPERASEASIQRLDRSGSTWVPVATSYDEARMEHTAHVRSLAPAFALVLGGEPARFERKIESSDHARGGPHSTRELLRHDFEVDMASWRLRRGNGGVALRLDREKNPDGSGALAIVIEEGAVADVSITRTPFDCREYPLLRFQYAVQGDVALNLYARVGGRWYGIVFTGQPHDPILKRVGLAVVGAMKDIGRDGSWNQVECNLYELLRARTGETVIEELVLGHLECKGYLKLRHVPAASSGSVFFDDFAILESSDAALDVDHDLTLVADYDKGTATNRLYARRFTFHDDRGGVAKTSFVERGAGGHAYELAYEFPAAGGFAGLAEELGGLDVRDRAALTFSLQCERPENLQVSLTDEGGSRAETRVRPGLLENGSRGWSRVVIPFSAFRGVIDRRRLKSVVFSVAGERAVKGQFRVRRCQL